MVIRYPSTYGAQPLSRTARLTFINWRPPRRAFNGGSLFADAMVPFMTLVQEWGRFEEAAFQMECRVERALDDYCDGRRAAPEATELAAVKRQRFIARHRLRWILHQLGKTRGSLQRL